MGNTEAIAKTEHDMEVAAQAKKKANEKKKKKHKKQQEKSRKKYAVLQKKKREAERKAKKEKFSKTAAAKRRMNEQLKKELAYKTNKKKLEVKTKKHAEISRKKIDTLIKSGIQLTITERKNKKRAEKDSEHAAKELVVKMQVAGVRKRRHERHERQYDEFVRDTIKRSMQKNRTDTQVAVAMKQTMKQRKRDMTQVLNKQKKTRAVVHLMGLRVEKLKAR